MNPKPPRDSRIHRIPAEIAQVPTPRHIRPPDYECIACGDRWSGSEPVEYTEYIRAKFEKEHAGHLTNLVNVKPNLENRKQERLWFSPHCLNPQPDLFA